MKLKVECISPNKSSMTHLISTDYCSYYDDADDNTVTCRFALPISNRYYRLPNCSITLTDKLMLSDNMVAGQEYECAIEISSFRTTELFSNHRNSIRGTFWNCVPRKYVSKYNIYRAQQCIEINGDILLIAPYNNSLNIKGLDGVLLEVNPYSLLNLVSIIT